VEDWEPRLGKAWVVVGAMLTCCRHVSMGGQGLPCCVRTCRRSGHRRALHVCGEVGLAAAAAS